MSKRIFEYCTNKKVSFDGKCFLIRFPKKIVQFLIEKKIPTDEIVLEGIW